MSKQTEKNKSEATAAATTSNSTDQKQTTGESRFKKEVEEEPFEGFTKFENVGDTKEGFIVGTKQIQGDNGKKTHYVILIGKEKFLLPNHANLTNKLEKLVSTKGGVIPSRGIEVQIEYTGDKEMGGTKSPMKEYKVRTT